MLGCDDPLPQAPHRILVAGVSGSGKTTLSRRIARITGVPHIEIDALFHGPGWVPRPQFLGEVQTFVQQEAWVTEWQYGSARPLLASNADVLVWLDHPFWRVTFPRVLRRTISRRLHRTELWNGNIEPPLWHMLTDRGHILPWALRTRHSYAPRISSLQHQHPHLTIVHLRSPVEVERWLAGALKHRPLS